MSLTFTVRGSKMDFSFISSKEYNASKRIQFIRIKAGVRNQQSVSLTYKS